MVAVRPSTSRAPLAEIALVRAAPTGKAPAPIELRRGSTGAAVRDVQQKLLSLGWLSRDGFQSGPGVFGPRTEDAVKRFQRANGLKPTGVVGQYTRAALANASRAGVDTFESGRSDAVTEPYVPAAVAPDQFEASSGD